MPLNVTRHEATEIRTEVDNWFESTGIEIQDNMLKSVKQTIEAFNLSFDIENVNNLDYAEVENKFGIKCKKNISKFE